jgi:hypothetical protein
MRQGLDRRLSQAWATKMLMLTMPNNAATISIITTVLYAPAQTKRHRGPNSQKNSASRTRFAMQLMISGNRDVPKREAGDAASVMAPWHGRLRSARLRRARCARGLYKVEAA